MSKMSEQAKMRAKYRSEKQQKEYDMMLSAEDYDSKLAIVYLIKIYGSEGSYHKIGYTTGTVFNRFLGESIPDYDRCLETRYMLIDDAKALEKALHDIFANKRYLPNAQFGGRFECFKLYSADTTLLESIFKQYK
jgi:T5orf172 domain